MVRTESWLTAGVLGLSIATTVAMSGQDQREFQTISMPIKTLSHKPTPNHVHSSESAQLGPRSQSSTIAPEAKAADEAGASIDSKVNPSKNQDGEPAVPGSEDEMQGPPSAEYLDGSYESDPIRYRYGQIVLSVDISNGQLDAIQIIEATTEGKAWEQVPPVLVEMALEARGSGFVNLSGATFSSNAFRQALENALGKASNQ